MAFFGSATMDAFVYITAFMALVYFYFTRNFGFWKKHGFPYDKPSPFVGNMKEMALLRKGLGEMLQTLYEKHTDKPYVGIFAFDKPGLLIRDLSILKNVLVKDSNNFIDHQMTISEHVDPLAGRCLPNLKGQKWRYYRNNLSPAFTSSKMRKMLYLVKNCGKELIQHLGRETADGKPVSVKDTMARYTTDVIACCGFGLQSNSLKDPDVDFRRYLHRVFDYSLTSIRQALFSITVFLAPDLQNLLKLKLVDDLTTDFLRKVTWSTVNHREETGVAYNDFLDCMMELRKKGRIDDDNEQISEANGVTNQRFELEGDDFVAQCFVFMAAGYESSSSTMCFALYELSLQPVLQEKVRAEMRAVLSKHKGELTYEAIQEMTYLDMVLAETLRKYPVLPILDRLCINDYKLPHPSGKGTLTLPANSGIYISLLGIHKDPAYYPDPEKFDPERFSEENKQKRPNCSYMPFGEGPRFCIGMRFGLMSSKSGMTHILTNYELSPSKDTPVPLVFDPKAYMLTATGSLPLHFKKIKNVD